jgi:predicted porin
MAMVGFGGVPGSTQDGSSNALELGYNKDGIEFKVMVDVAYDPAGQLSTLFQYSREYTAGGTLTLADWKLFAGYQSQSAPDMVVSYGNPNKATQYWLGANYKVTPNLVLIPAAYHVDLNQNIGGASLFMLGANYYLSKHTIVFASVGTLKNSALSSFAIEVGTSAIGVNQDAFYTGVSHSF